MRLTHVLLGSALIAACGSDKIVGSDSSLDDSGNDGTAKDSSSDTGGSDAANDTGGGSDTGTVDAGICVPPQTACSKPCPPGTICLRKSTGPVVDLGCTVIPPVCASTPTCACMGSCFCPEIGPQKCVDQVDGLLCNSGAVSKRDRKKDIDYVSDGEREELANEALRIPLATYRYKTEQDDSKKHLGFIIDDQPKDSPAVQSDRAHVDEYGYTSMLLATVQEQQKQIETLRSRLDKLERQCK